MLHVDLSPYGALNRGPFLLARARATGLSRKKLHTLCCNGSVRRVLHNVYVDAELPDSVELRARALALVVPPHVVICDRTAAWLHGVDTLNWSEVETLPRVETCVPPEQTRVRRPECKGARRDLVPTDVEQLRGLAVTTPLRTALDLGCSLRRSAGGRPASGAGAHRVSAGGVARRVVDTARDRRLGPADAPAAVPDPRRRVRTIPP